MAITVWMQAVPAYVDMTAATPPGSFAADCTAYTKAEANDFAIEQMKPCFPSSLQLDRVHT